MLSTNQDVLAKWDDVSAGGQECGCSDATISSSPAVLVTYATLFIFDSDDPPNRVRSESRRCRCTGLDSRFI